MDTLVLHEVYEWAVNVAIQCRSFDHSGEAYSPSALAKDVKVILSDRINWCSGMEVTPIANGDA